jgi:hypothetical protein
MLRSAWIWSCKVVWTIFWLKMFFSIQLKHLLSIIQIPKRVGRRLITPFWYSIIILVVCSGEHPNDVQICTLVICLFFSTKVVLSMQSVYLLWHQRLKCYQIGKCKLLNCTPADFSIKKIVLEKQVSGLCYEMHSV